MSKKSRKEGNRVACLIKANKTEIYIADVDLGDNTKDVLAASNSVVKTLGKKRAAFMLVSAGIKVITVLAYVPDELLEKLDPSTWLHKSVTGVVVGQKNDNENSDTDNCVMTVIEAETPFKLKDAVRSNGFAHLNKLGLTGDDEESSEEFIGFDDL